MYQFIRLSVLVLLVVVGQFVVLPVLVVPMLVPQLVVLLVVLGGLRWGLVTGLLLAVTAGLVADVASATIFGLHGLWLVATVTLVQIISNALIGSGRVPRVVSQSAIVFVSSVVGGMIVSGMSWVVLVTAGVTTIIGGILIFSNAQKET